MTKKHISLFILALVVLLIYGNCYQVKLPEPANVKLPEQTQSGKNTFGCVVDNKPFKNKNYWQVILVIPTKVRGLSAIYYPADSVVTNHSFQLSADMNYAKVDRTFNLFYSGKEAPKTGVTYELNLSKDSFSSYYGDNTFYESTNTDYLSITFSKFDLENKIASGTFTGTLVAPDSTGTKVAVTEGRFDVKFNSN